LKKILTVSLCVLLVLCLCGCSLYAVDTDTLLAPPQLTGDMYPIQQALLKSVKGEFALKYPASGEYRSAVICEDIDGDKQNEAFAFYSTNEDDQTRMYINLLKKNGKEYISLDSISITASGVEKVEFFDVDGDNTKEILVGWQVYANSEKQFAIYSVSSDTLVQRFLGQYTNFACFDMDENGKLEVFVQELNTKTLENKATVYNFGKKGATKIAGAVLDGTVKTVSDFKISRLSTGQPAVYIDEIKGIGSITEVLFMSKGELKNPLLGQLDNSFENIITIRSASMNSADINGDDIPEIPIVSDMPCADTESDEKVYYTNWCSYNGESLTVKRVSIVNIVDGYSLIIPQRWINSIALYKDTDKRIRTVYAYNSQTNEVGEKIVSFRAFEQSEFEKEEKNLGKNIVKLGSKNGTVYIAIPSSYNGKLALTSSELEKILNLDSF